ncbi:MAG TPA: hypothetical protein VKC51_11455, partial [Lacunisphaera sp.]|nr:hypothetical protein [Lacunisphaera sp.]
YRPDIETAVGRLAVRFGLPAVIDELEETEIPVAGFLLPGEKGIEQHGRFAAILLDVQIHRPESLQGGPIRAGFLKQERNEVFRGFDRSVGLFLPDEKRPPVSLHALQWGGSEQRRAKQPDYEAEKHAW